MPYGEEGGIVEGEAVDPRRVAGEPAHELACAEIKHRDVMVLPTSDERSVKGSCFSFVCFVLCLFLFVFVCWFVGFCLLVFWGLS